MPKAIVERSDEPTTDGSITLTECCRVRVQAIDDALSSQQFTISSIAGDAHRPRIRWHEHGAVRFSSEFIDCRGP